ncbi:MAG: TIGR04211 family SH3 domain-containing protein [Desulfobacterales bacterium]|nr:TIGR04211 family SH3 domain-containing protein [Desulfobacterales bacterium]
MFISDNLKITLRSGPSTGNKILAVLQSGQTVEVVNPGDEWSQVTMADGKEGWVLSRYLTPNPTHNLRLERLDTKHKNLMAQAAALLEENNKLKAESKRLRSEFQTTQNQMQKTTSEYETLKTEAAEFLTLKANYDRAASQLAKQTEKAQTLEEQLTKMEMNYAIKWFLAGSAVLIVGFLIGFSTKRQRRRPSLV